MNVSSKYLQSAVSPREVMKTRLKNAFVLVHTSSMLIRRLFLNSAPNAMHSLGSRHASGCLYSEHTPCDVPNRVQEAWPFRPSRLFKIILCCRNTWVRLSKATKIQLPGLATWEGAENIAVAPRMYKILVQFTSVSRLQQQ